MWYSGTSGGGPPLFGHFGCPDSLNQLLVVHWRVGINSEPEDRGPRDPLVTTNSWNNIHSTTTASHGQPHRNLHLDYHLLSISMLNSHLYSIARALCHYFYYYTVLVDRHARRFPSIRLQ